VSNMERVIVGLPDWPGGPSVRHIKDVAQAVPIAIHETKGGSACS
jgi:hypothetical protein